VRNEQVLHRVNEERNTLQTTKRRKVNWTGYILRRNCPLRHVTEGKIKGRIEATRRRGRISKQLLDDVKEMRGCWKLKEEALDRTPWKTLFGRGYGPVVRQTTE
jgi:ribosomal protein L35